MIDVAAISEIIETYKKHGWILRRVLLSAATKERLGPESEAAVGSAAIMDADMDIAWFSRPPKSGGVSWEIRFLGATPFAFLEVIDESAADFENSLRTVETRLRERIAEGESA